MRLQLTACLLLTCAFVSGCGMVTGAKRDRLSEIEEARSTGLTYADSRSGDARCSLEYSREQQASLRVKPGGTQTSENRSADSSEPRVVLGPPSWVVDELPPPVTQPSLQQPGMPDPVAPEIELVPIPTGQELPQPPQVGGAIPKVNQTTQELQQPPQVADPDQAPAKAGRLPPLSPEPSLARQACEQDQPDARAKDMIEPAQQTGEIMLVPSNPVDGAIPEVSPAARELQQPTQVADPEPAPAKARLLPPRWLEQEPLQRGQDMIQAAQWTREIMEPPTNPIGKPGPVTAAPPTPPTGSPVPVPTTEKNGSVQQPVIINLPTPTQLSSGTPQPKGSQPDKSGQTELLPGEYPIILGPSSVIRPAAATQPEKKAPGSPEIGGRRSEVRD